MTAVYNHLTHRRRPITLDTYECRNRWRDRAFTAKDCVSTDGAELTFEYGCPRATAFRAGRDCGHLNRNQAGAAGQAYACYEDFIRGWQFAQRWPVNRREP
jgi:hypothetical protein